MLQAGKYVTCFYNSQFIDDLTGNVVSDKRDNKDIKNTEDSQFIDNSLITSNNECENFSILTFKGNNNNV